MVRTPVSHLMKPLNEIRNTTETKTRTDVPISVSKFTRLLISFVLASNSCCLSLLSADVSGLCLYLCTFVRLLHHQFNETGK